MGLTGTVTVYRCHTCRQTWTWRNTPDNDPVIRQLQHTHRGHRLTITTDGAYQGRHRDGEPVAAMLDRIRWARWGLGYI
ncbi:hypothetical protein SEA_VERITY_86 [Gordonia phage Verity]|uniref:Uncharacterized protein n=2 Tax=Zitchvirus TaxID=2948963 RepID=A0A514DIZ3_9CAUD|nr:hypothetical protein J1775_gp87 [Gordonia phage Zipp]YP_010002924.1 hypothetical protein J1776_gp86 [Gordonia phage Verity]QPO16930.1 hypothetical protein SEA_DELREY21_87 [Gordonia phage Delrey21]QXN74213.1 hypothetical protein SEA_DOCTORFROGGO_87 [Gordonia phage DoctorFroggo]QDH93240.1 hypothetical protein SEA_ZIPP_87 [Gordonia phage Zipp]QDH93572.1 hypothetical protein SEA_VERITY_86 [Gordonia phage Verity]